MTLRRPVEKGRLIGRKAAGAILCVLVTAGGEQSWAETTPTRGAVDGRIRFATYSDQEVYRLHGFPGYQIDLQFEPGEKFVGIGAGDLDGISFVGQENHLFLKPKAIRVATNLTVLTTRREYLFEYSSAPFKQGADDSEIMYSLRFVYPLPESTDELAAAAIALEAQFRGTEVNGRRNTDYWYCGHPSIQPVSAFDDGVHTHFRFSAVAELPAIFVLNDDGGESLLNFHVENGEIVIHRIARRFVLRRGTATGCVVNGSFGGSGRRLDSGTVTPTVQRKTIGDGR